MVRQGESPATTLPHTPLTKIYEKFILYFSVICAIIEELGVARRK